MTDVAAFLDVVAKHGGTVVGYSLFIIIVYQLWTLLKRGILAFFEGIAYSVREFFDAQTETLREALAVGKETKQNTYDIIEQLNVILERISEIDSGRCKEEYKEISSKLSQLLQKLNG